MAVVQITTSCTIGAITNGEHHELAIWANTSRTFIQTRIQITFKRHTELWDAIKGSFKEIFIGWFAPWNEPVSIDKMLISPSDGGEIF